MFTKEEIREELSKFSEDKIPKRDWHIFENAPQTEYDISVFDFIKRINYYYKINSNCCWISPEGKKYPCAFGDHINTAQVFFGKREEDLELTHFKISTCFAKPLINRHNFKEFEVENICKITPKMKKAVEDHLFEE